MWDREMDENTLKAIEEIATVILGIALIYGIWRS
jgi:hypothetical protein